MKSPYHRGDAEILASAIQAQKQELAAEIASVTHDPPSTCNWQVNRMEDAYTRLAIGDALFLFNDN